MNITNQNAIYVNTAICTLGCFAAPTLFIPSAATGLVIGYVAGVFWKYLKVQVSVKFKEALPKEEGQYLKIWDFAENQSNVIPGQFLTLMNVIGLAANCFKAFPSVGYANGFTAGYLAGKKIVKHDPVSCFVIRQMTGFTG